MHRCDDPFGSENTLTVREVKETKVQKRLKLLNSMKLAPVTCS